MSAENLHSRRYVSVILPVRYSGEVSYFLPENFEVFVGQRVRVDFAGKIYPAVVTKILNQEVIPAFTPEGKEILYKPVLAVEELPRILETEMQLWDKVAQYYLCTPGEVFKAAYPSLQIRQESVKPRKGVDHFLECIAGEGEIVGPQLSGRQQEAGDDIKRSFGDAPGKPVLLRGVTGSGKTEIYISMALEQLKQGKNVLYLVPEIAISKQLQSRLKSFFGERLLTFHSKQTVAERARIHKILAYNAEHSSGEGVNTATVVLGTRSSLFLPLGNLGLVIVDEEHDSSYKQSEPAPRYHAKDTAIMLSHLHGCNILLGSATPSFESEYNCLIGKFHLVEL